MEGDEGPDCLREEGGPADRDARPERVHGPVGSDLPDRPRAKARPDADRLPGQVLRLPQPAIPPIRA